MLNFYVHTFRRSITHVFPLKSYSISSTLTPSLVHHINGLCEEYLRMKTQAELDIKSVSDKDALFKKLTRLEVISNFQQEHKQLQKEYDVIENSIASETDKDMVSLLSEELKELESKILSVESSMRRFFIPIEEEDTADVLLEVRAGTGGQEASLFTTEIFQMYEKYSEGKGWKFETLSKYLDETTGGKGYREATANISGKGAYGRLKFESGVHRVQRVPSTDSQGRVHTSTMTVALLPKPKELSLILNEKDLRIDTYRSGGPGGQHVNTTSSAVRITHMPSGIVVACQDERSQHQNRSKAMLVLQSRILQKMAIEKDQSEQSTRRSLIGSAGRSEKIRTYNFPQNRISDHRIAGKGSTANLNIFMEGEMDDMIDALIVEQEAAILASFEKNISLG